MIDFKIGPSAHDKLLDVLDISKQEKLRISIKGGGCAGFEYKFDIESEIEEYDLVFSQDQVELVHLIYIEGYMDIPDPSMQKGFIMAHRKD